GQREPAAVRPAVPAVAAGGVADAARTPGGALVPRTTAGGGHRRGRRPAAEMGDAVLAGQPAVDRAAAADPPGPASRMAPAGAGASAGLIRNRRPPSTPAPSRSCRRTCPW